MLTGAMKLKSMVAGGVGVIRAGLRGTSPVQSAEQLLCNSSRPVSALIAKATAAVDNDLVMEAGEPVPRLVFGGVPSFEEAKEATGDLKEFLDAMYLSSPKSVESEASLIPEVFLPLHSAIVNNRSGVINTSNPGTERVHQAFRLLSQSTKIQDCISSLAADPKIYEAVLENSAVKKFIHAHQTSSDTFEDEANVTRGGESGVGVMEKLKNVKDFISKMVTDLPIHFPGLFGSSATESSSGSGPDHKENPTMKDGKSGSSFMEKFRNLKNSVVEMATNIPKYVSNVYGSSAAECVVSISDDKGNTVSAFPESSLRAHLTALGIMVIMIVVFKRV